MSSPLLELLTGTAVLILAGLGGLATILVSRRLSSGRISTSEASVLWDQAQKMRAELEGQRDRATEQRDRLIEAQSSQVLPVLQMVVDSLRQITESLARLETGGKPPP